jgi:hypothetical protein
MKGRFQLFAAIIFAGVGTMAIVLRRIRSATIHEMNATGFAAQFVGVLYVTIAIMLFADWLRKR